MKRIITTISVYAFMAIALVLSSCLKGDDSNTPPGKSPQLMVISFDPAALAGGGTAINSGLQYFGSASLTYPASDTLDIAWFAVTIQNGVASKDINVTTTVDESALLDNFAADSINYTLMPDSLYDFVDGITSGKIAKGTTTSPLFGIKFYPNKIDPTKNYMLPIKAANDGGVTVATNHQTIYLHAIGNLLAGSYHDLYNRWNKGDTLGAASYAPTDLTETFLPDNPNTIEVQSGYAATVGLTYRYKITFDKDVNNNLSNFKAVINPDDVTATLTGSGISLTSQVKIIYMHVDVASVPHIVHCKFTFGVYNGTANRTFTDEYTLQ